MSSKHSFLEIWSRIRYSPRLRRFRLLPDRLKSQLSGRWSKTMEYSRIIPRAWDQSGSHQLGMFRTSRGSYQIVLKKQKTVRFGITTTVVRNNIRQSGPHLKSYDYTTLKYRVITRFRVRSLTNVKRIKPNFISPASNPSLMSSASKRNSAKII